MATANGVGRVVERVGQAHVDSPAIGNSGSHVDLAAWPERRRRVRRQ
jgi:hypothetical protein